MTDIGPARFYQVIIVFLSQQRDISTSRKPIVERNEPWRYDTTGRRCSATQRKVRQGEAWWGECREGGGWRDGIGATRRRKGRGAVRQSLAKRDEADSDTCAPFKSGAASRTTFPMTWILRLLNRDRALSSVYWVSSSETAAW